MAIDEKQLLVGEAALEKVRALLADFPIAFMLTILDGAVTARPIGVVGDHAAFSGSLWFITDPFLVAAFAKSILTGRPGASGDTGVAQLPTAINRHH